MTTITVPSTDSSPRIRGWLGQLGVDTAYALVGLPLAVAAFTVVVTGLSVGAGLLITVIGLPVLVATVYAARGLAHLERARIRPVLRRGPSPVVYHLPDPDLPWWRRMLATLGDGQAWLDLLHAVVRLPVSVFSFSVVLSWWASALGGLSYWFWQRWLPAQDPDNHDLPELLGFGRSTDTRITFYLVLGALTALTLPLVVRGCALLEAWVAHGMLNGVAGMRAEISGLSARARTARAQTAAAVSAEASALRRLERDIHDGPQQRLVRLAMDLGRARQQLETDPEAARASVDEAMTQARETLDELRTLSRGIAPPILTDRGLGAAIAALAARSTVPIRLELPEELGRLDPVTEQTAYFAVAEALTNLAKHSGAGGATVSMAVADDRLAVTVSDDGVGGAHLAKGHGLAGLADRLHSAGGELWVSSPPGGPTHIRAEVPCPHSE
jgi:signal transduction histidine kinase